LVEWQLRVAFGEALPKQQDELGIHGHAIEARVYAENPEKGFLPSIGTLRHMDVPRAVAFELGSDGANPAAVRVDSGVREGDAISPFYDPMIAKLIVWGADRTQALARMSQALSEFRIVGLATNIAFLKRLVEGEAFATADLDTGLIERHGATLFPPAAPAPLGALALAVFALRENAANDADPWSQASGWRMNGDYRRVLSWSDESGAYRVGLTYRRDGLEIDLDGQAQRVERVGRAGDDLALRLGETAVQGVVRRDGDVFHVFTGGQHFTLTYNDPMAVLVQAGATVVKGEPLVIMEAMKMEHTIAAPGDGVVEDVLYEVGDQVADGAPLLAFKAA
jgi:3-methylcrotonyl-CoA carboxylase alpha subunit